MSEQRLPSEQVNDGVMNVTFRAGMLRAIDETVHQHAGFTLPELIAEQPDLAGRLLINAFYHYKVTDRSFNAGAKASTLGVVHSEITGFGLGQLSEDVRTINVFRQPREYYVLDVLGIQKPTELTYRFDVNQGSAAKELDLPLDTDVAA